MSVKGRSAKGWLVPISGAVSVLAVAAGAVSGLLQWQSEATARQAEVELRAFKDFIALVEFAHGRSSYQWSENCAKFLAGNISVGDADGLEAVELYNKAFEHGCSMRLPVGAASQEAAVIMIATFGMRFPFLKDAARQALHSLRTQGLMESPTAVDVAIKMLDG